MKVLLRIISNAIKGFTRTVPILQNMSILLFHVIGFFQYFTAFASFFVDFLNVPKNSPGIPLGSCGPAPKTKGNLHLNQLHVVEMAYGGPINVHH